MKAVLLAAGKGERLGKLTQGVPKPMIPTDGKPILEWNIELCRKHGVTELFINLFHLPHIIKEYFGDGSRFGVSIKYSEEAELLGTAGGVKQFSDMLMDKPFFVIYGDNRSNYNLIDFQTYHERQRAQLTIALFHLDEVHQSGVAILGEDNRILEFVEKPTSTPPPSHWVNAGIYIMDPSLLTQIPEGPCDFGRDLFPRWIAGGVNIHGILMAEKVTAIDTVELLEKWKNN